MEEVEYLEEYEDLILPIMSSNSVAAEKNRTNPNINGDDEDSSSIDQDIFESLFDDHSDDDVVPPKKVEPKLTQRHLTDRFSLDSLDMLVKDLGEQLSPQSRLYQKGRTDTMSDKLKPSNKSIRKETTSAQTTTNARSNTSLSSNVNASSQKTDVSFSFDKPKSVATVRPTMQQTQTQERSLSTKTVSQDRSNQLTTSSSSSSTNAIKTSTSVPNAPKVTTSNSLVQRKQIPNAASTSSTNTHAKASAASSPKKPNRIQPTIVKPEKQLSKDPLVDPLSLENLNNVSDSESDEYALSDISADTFVSLSDVDDDDRHIIELSNDSSYERGNLDKIRGSTPSPTVSDDFRSDKEESPLKLSNQLDTIECEKPDGNEKEISNSNSANDNKRNVNDFVSSDVLDPVVDNDATSKNAKENLCRSSEALTAQPDNLLERIDSLLLQTVDQDDSLFDKNVTEISAKTNIVKEKSTLPSLSSTSNKKQNTIKDKVDPNAAKGSIENKSTNMEYKNKGNDQKQSFAVEVQSERKPVPKQECNIDAGKEKFKENDSSPRKKPDDVKSSKEVKEKTHLEKNTIEKKDANNKKSGESDKVTNIETHKKAKPEHKPLELEGKDQRRSDKHCVKTEKKKCEKRENVKKNSDDRKTVEHYKESDKKRIKEKEVEKYEENPRRKHDDRKKEYKKEGDKRKDGEKEREREVEKYETSKKMYDKDSYKKRVKGKDIDMREENNKEKHDDRRVSEVNKDSPKKYVKEKEVKGDDGAKRKNEDYKQLEKLREPEKRKIREKELEKLEKNDEYTKRKSDDRGKVMEHNKGYGKNCKEQERGKRDLSLKKQTDEHKPVEKKKESDTTNVKEQDKELQRKEEKGKKPEDGSVSTEKAKKDERISIEKEKKDERISIEKEKKDERISIEKENKDERIFIEKENKDERISTEKEKNDERISIEKEKKDERISIGKEKKDERISIEKEKKDERISTDSKDSETKNVKQNKHVDNIEGNETTKEHDNKKEIETKAVKPTEDENLVGNETQLKEKDEVRKETDTPKSDEKIATEKVKEHDKKDVEKNEKESREKSEDNNRNVEKVKEPTEEGEKENEKSPDIGTKESEEKSTVEESSPSETITVRGEEDKNNPLVSIESSEEPQQTLDINKKGIEGSNVTQQECENVTRTEGAQAPKTESEANVPLSTHADKSSEIASESTETEVYDGGPRNDVAIEISNENVKDLEKSNDRNLIKHDPSADINKKTLEKSVEAEESPKLETLKCAPKVEESSKDAVGSNTDISVLEKNDGLTRRTLRKRGNEHSPSNTDRNKKAGKDPIPIMDISKQKERARTVTPTIGRKRNRQNILAILEKEDKEVSPANKKQKLDTLKKCTRSMYLSDGEKPIDTNEGENHIEKSTKCDSKMSQTNKEKEVATTSQISNKKRNTTEAEEPPKKIARSDVKIAANQIDVNKSKLNITDSEEQSLTPGKRFRRLKAIDDDYLIHKADKDKSGTSDKSVRSTENKQITATRKSLRSKVVEESQNLISKPIEENNKQSKAQQKPHSERLTDELKISEKQISKNNSGGKKEKSSPNKPIGSNVMTFTEWLQQKQGEKDEKCESSKQNESQIEKVALATSSKRSSNKIIPASSKKNEPKQGNQKQCGNTADSTNKQQKGPDKVDNSSQEIKIEVPLVSTRETRRRVVANISMDDFKKPITPQRSRSTVLRSTNSTPIPSDVAASKSQTISGKTGKVFKLRKLRVRINRSVVSTYFKNFKQAMKQKEKLIDVKQPEVKTTLTNSVSEINKTTNDPKATITVPVSDMVKSIIEPKTTTTLVSDSIVPTRDTKLNRSRDKSHITISQKRVSLKSNTTLPSLTVRPIMSGPANIMTIPPEQRRPPTIATAYLEDLENSAISPGSGNAGHGNKDDLSLLTPMKSVSSVHEANGNRTQQFPAAQLQKQSTIKETTREKSNNQAHGQGTHISQNDTIISTINQDTQLPFIAVEPKKELEEELQTAVLSTETSNANSLASRTLAIAAATNSALNQLPTNDANAFCGLTPTVLDANGTRLYSFLHPAKYNRNHGCVLLDYCCPNLDGPMPAIDPTRIHAQVQAAVRELPAYIVMTTKLITRADLEANKNVIPASIRQKVEKITADAIAVNATSQGGHITSLNTATNTSLSTLHKNLPSTTTITQKQIPSTATTSSTHLPPLTPFSALTNSQNLTQTPSGPVLTEYQRSLLRTHVRQFDARLKKYYYRIAVLTFAERQRVIDGIVNSTATAPKEVENAVRLLDEYVYQINKISASVSSASASASVATRQVSASDVVQRTGTTNTPVQQKAGGYQLTSTTFTMNKSTMSTRSSAMSASSMSTKHTSLPNVALTNTSAANLKTVAQDSPRIFYTKTPLQTSTPIAASTGTGAGGSTTPIQLRSTPRMARNVTIRQLTPSTSISSAVTKGLPTLTRNPHLNTPTTSSNLHSANTVTTRSSVTVTTETKRLTRKTAAAAAQKVIVITQNDSRTTLDECILPDDHNKPEIKREKDDEDFIGGG